MVNAATRGGVGLNGYVERPGIATYLQLGYAPQTVFGAGASITLECRRDFAISRFAESLGDSATAAEFQNRRNTGRTFLIPARVTSRPAAQPGPSVRARPSCSPVRASARKVLTRATLSNTSGGAA